MISQISDYLDESSHMFPHMCRVKFNLEFYESGPNGCIQKELTEIKNQYGFIDIHGFDRSDCVQKTNDFINKLSEIKVNNG